MAALLIVLLALVQGISCVSQSRPAEPTRAEAGWQRPPVGDGNSADAAAAPAALPPSVSADTFTDYWLERAEGARAQAAAPTMRESSLSSDAVLAADAVPADLAPEAEPEPQRPLPTQAVSLIMRDASVRDVLQALARSADINLLVGAKVTGTLTVELRDAAWDEAFTGLTTNLGLHYCWSGDILRVVTVEELQESLKVDSAQRDRLAMEQARQQAEPLLVETFALHYTDAAKLEPVFRAVLTKSDGMYTAPADTVRALPRGDVVADTENNTVVVHAIRSDLAKVGRLVEILDRPRLQVLIEARIVMANRETARELGVQWGALYANGRSMIYPGANSTGVLGSSIDKPIAPTGGFTGNFPAGGQSTSTTSGGTDSGTDGGSTATTPAGAALSGLQFGYAYQKLGSLLLTSQLSALESAGKAQIVAMPSITTLENQEAELKSGFEIPFQSTSEDEGTSVQFKEVLLELKVRPHVISGSMVRLSITASNDEPDYSRVDAGITDEPAVSRRSAQTNVVLFSGQTTVIGGLSRSYGSDSKKGIPWLMNLPWLGALFRSKASLQRHEEMMIFITPYILDEVGTPTLLGPAPGAEAPAVQPEPAAKESER